MRRQLPCKQVTHHHRFNWQLQLHLAGQLAGQMEKKKTTSPSRLRSTCQGRLLLLLLFYLPPSVSVSVYPRFIFWEVVCTACMYAYTAGISISISISRSWELELELEPQSQSQLELELGARSWSCDRCVVCARLCAPRFVIVKH